MQIGGKSADQHGCHESRSSKLNFSDYPAYYSTVLHKHKSPAIFCEKRPKRVLSTTLPSRFVGILFKAPKISHEDYFNRKHFYSFLVQGIVDASGLYFSVATGFPGSLHDAWMLCLTDIGLLKMRIS